MKLRNRKIRIIEQMSEEERGSIVQKLTSTLDENPLIKDIVLK